MENKALEVHEMTSRHGNFMMQDTGTFFEVVHNGTAFEHN
jgi:hypothetical protein